MGKPLPILQPEVVPHCSDLGLVLGDYLIVAYLQSSQLLCDLDSLLCDDPRIFSESCDVLLRLLWVGGEQIEFSLTAVQLLDHVLSVDEHVLKFH